MVSSDPIDRLNTVTVGVISDTHGQLHPQVRRLFEHVDLIVHAGDVCGHGVIEGLREIAPLHAVSGNCDSSEANPGLPGFDLFRAGGRNVAVIHILQKLLINPAAAGVDVVVYGHTHIAAVERVDGVLYVNPGSAGPPRFGRGRSVAILNITASVIDAEIVEFGS